MDAALIHRFTNSRTLVANLTRQSLLLGIQEIAEEVSKRVKLIQLDTGDVLIHKSDVDNDIYFILAGEVGVKVNARQVAVRGPGHSVGEMTMLDAATTRSATVAALQPTVVAKLSEEDFSEVADAFPAIWRNMASELAQRLRQRDRFVGKKNTSPHIFIACASENLSIANVVRDYFCKRDLICKVWTEGVFGPSNFPLEDLELTVSLSDFAIFLFGADDKVQSRGKDSGAPRDNVVFELGLFMGAITRHRTFILQPNNEDIKIPSDLLGLTVLRYEPLDKDKSSLTAACQAVEEKINDLGTK